MTIWAVLLLLHTEAVDGLLRLLAVEIGSEGLCLTTGQSSHNTRGKGLSGSTRLAGRLHVQAQFVETLDEASVLDGRQSLLVVYLALVKILRRFGGRSLQMAWLKFRRASLAYI